MSSQTVSNVINDRGGFTPVTRARVEAAIADTGYLPNRAARQLRTRRSRQIGFPLDLRHPGERNEFTLAFLEAVANAARPSHHRIVVFACERGDADTLEHWLSTDDLDGFVFCGVSPGDVRTGVLAAHGVPFVVMGRTSPDEPQTWVDVDDRGGMGAIVDHLVERGHRTFGYVGHDAEHHWSVERLEGVRTALDRHGLRLADDATIIGEFEDVSSGIESMLAAPGRPSAVITDSDLTAIFTTGHARALGLEVGVELAVTGFDGGPLDELLQSRLTAVRIPIQTVADLVVERLVRELEHGPTGEPGTFVAPDLRLGTST